MKSHYDYNVYTPALINELKALVANVPRAEGVKRLAKRLDISDRNARRQYAKYMEGAVPEMPRLNVWTQANAGLGDDLLKIAKDTNQTFETVGTAAAELARQGLHKKDLLKRLKDALILSRIAGINTVKSVKQLRTAIQEMPVQSLTDGRPIRRLFLDLETSPNIGMFWRAGFKLTITPESIIKERAIICAGYKWSDEKEAHVLVWDKNQDDKALLAALIPIIGQADEIIMHNGDRFDMPWVRTRALFHGLPPIPDVRTIDTLKWARSKFYFNSNKLDYIAKYLGIGAKIKTEYGLWKDVVLNHDAKALARMSDYCANDVLLLEKVWARLFDLIAPKTHVGVLGGGDKWQCPRTGSTDVSVSKTRVSAAGTVTYQMKTATGSYYSISSTAHQAYLEAKGRA